MARHVLTALAVLTFITAASAGDILGVPTDGFDLVLLDDGRIIRCKVGVEYEGKIELELPTECIQILRTRVTKIRLFADFDSTPLTDDEKAKAAKGQVKWDGKWMDAKRAAKLREAEEAPLRAIRELDLAHAKWEDRWHHKTKHFEFEANVGRESLDYFAGLLEAYYSHITKHFRIKLTQRDRKKKLPVYALRDREEFMAFNEKDVGGDSEHLLGYFVPTPGQERLVFFDQPGGRSDTVPTLLHEATHFILHLANRQVILPRWVHEGMAEYYGASEQKGKHFVPGGVQDGRLLHFLEMAQRNKLVSMRQLFIAGNRYLPDGVTGCAFEGEHYAQSWIIVHYLMKANKGRLAKRWIEYLNRWLTGKGIAYTPIEASDQKTLSPAEDQALLLRCLKIKTTKKLLDAAIAYAKTLELRSPVAYVERGAYLYWYEKNESGADAAFRKAEELGSEDPAVLLEMARTYSQIPGRAGKVLGLIEAALDIDPVNVDVRYIYSRLVGQGRAIRELRLCTEIDPNHARALGKLAWLLYRDEMKTGSRAEGEDLEIATEALGLAKRAVSLDPSDDNLDTIAALYLVLGKFTEARDHAIRAVQLNPEITAYLDRLAQAHAVCGDKAKFVKTLRRAEMILSRPSEEGGMAPGEEAVRKKLDQLAMGAVDLCDAWGKKKQALETADAWFKRRPPATAAAWTVWVHAAYKCAGAERALEIAKKGAEAFPDDETIRNWVDRMAEEADK
jgi:tetratricopeptide (TPR) repeat protein